MPDVRAANKNAFPFGEAFLLMDTDVNWIVSPATLKRSAGRVGLAETPQTWGYLFFLFL